MKIDFVELDRCPLCDCESWSTILSSDRFRHGLTTVMCDDCLLAYTNPMPSDEFLTRFYERNYRRYYTSYSKPSPTYIKRLGRDVRAKYHAEYLDERIDLSTLSYAIDVGAAEGSLLKALREHCSAETRFIGVEPNGLFSAFGLEKRYYDQVVPTIEELEVDGDGKVLISLVHILEHIFDPHQFVLALRRKLKATDLLFVDVPNVSEYTDITSVHVAHLYHFDKETLSEFVHQNGFQILDVEEHEPPYHPKSIRLLCEVSEKASITERCYINDTNRQSRSARLTRAFERVNDSIGDFFSFRNIAERAARRQWNLLKRFLEDM